MSHGRAAVPVIARYTAAYAVLTALGALFAMPALWMISSSLHDSAGVFAQPFRWLPAEPHFENYTRALHIVPFGRFFINTMLVTVPSVLFTVVSCSLVAYGFARLRFPGRDLLFSICLATMMLPGQVTMIPQYMLFARLGWIDTLLPLIVPSLFGTPFYIFLLRQFFLTIPRESDDAALIDGAGRLRILWSIVLPQARPALATVVLFSFINSWNDFFTPLLYINTPEHATLTLGLNMMKTQMLGSGVVEWNTLMAASVMVMVPNVILFLLAQKHFVRGIAAGARMG
ncbi:MAG: carbohydrate ABC transporter permease [Ignavibacteriae bacterium]|nr:carbohydrate ABC transporter permease [Ignavibacteriota bacterium]